MGHNQHLMGKWTNFSLLFSTILHCEVCFLTDLLFMLFNIVCADLS